LNEELHVSIEAFAHPVDCYGRLSHALYELRRHLVPVCLPALTVPRCNDMQLATGASMAVQKFEYCAVTVV